MRIALLFTLLFTTGICEAQDLKTKFIPVFHTDYSASAEILLEKKTINPQDDVYYYWIKAKQIHITQGGYDGNLLHGAYKEMYHSDQLKTKGQFKYGVKSGEWKSWWENGNIKEVSRWKNGKLNGRIRQYDENGKLVFNGKYIDAKYSGTIMQLDSSGNEVHTKYKNGQPKIKKEKVKKRIRKKDIIPLEEKAGKEIPAEEKKKSKRREKKKTEEKNASEEIPSDKKAKPEKPVKDKKKKSAETERV